MKNLSYDLRSDTIRNIAFSPHHCQVFTGAFMLPRRLEKPHGGRLRFVYYIIETSKREHSPYAGRCQAPDGFR